MEVLVSKNMLKIKNYLYRKKFYWVTKKWINNKPVFSFWKKLFDTKSNLSEGFQSYRALKESVPTVVFYSFISGFFILIAEILPKAIHWSLLSLGNLAGNHLPYLSGKLLSLNSIVISLNTDTYTSLLTTIAATSGVFLGLYFTTLSVVAGNLFPKLTENIRTLFIQEKVGAQYIKVISFSMLVSVGYLLLQVLGYHGHSIGPVLITIIAFYGVGTFMFLGFRAFYFFDPTKLCPIPLNDVYKNIKLATVDGFRHSDQNFSNHYQKQASKALVVLKELTEYAVKNNKNDSFENQLVKLSASFGYLLKSYIGSKKKIPTESFWYRNKAQYPKWLLADSIEVSLALNTGTSLNPKFTREKDWFEKECIDLVAQPLPSLIMDKNWSAVQNIIERGFVDLGEDIGNQFDIGNAKLLLDKLNDVLQSAYSEDNFNSDDGLTAIIDSHGRVATSLLLGLMKYIEGRNSQNIIDDFKSIQWEGHTGIYKTNLSHLVLSELEFMSKALNQEVMIEGKVVSPDWYLQTLYVRKHIEVIKTYFDFLCKLHDDFYLKNIEILKNKKCYVLMAQFMQRWLEYLNKMEWLLPKFNTYIVECKKFHKVKDLPWPEINTDDIQKKISEWHKNAMVNMAGLLPSLSLAKRTNDQPDYFGQAYTLAVEECYWASANNEPQHFQKIFPLVFLACLSAYDITRKEVVGWNTESQILFSSEPIIDLLELSGYSAIYSELYENDEMWKLCQQYWDKYLSDANASNVINFIVSLVNYRNSVFKIMPKAHLRTNWDIRLKQLLRERNLISDPFEERYLKVEKPKHNSPVIRVLSYYGDILSVPAIDVFFALYLSNHQMATGVTFPDRHEIKRKIEEEKNPSKTYEEQNATEN